MGQVPRKSHDIWVKAGSVRSTGRRCLVRTVGAAPSERPSTHPVSSKQSLATAHAPVHPAGTPAETRPLPTAPLPGHQDQGCPQETRQKLRTSSYGLMLVPRYALAVTPYASES